MSGELKKRLTSLDVFRGVTIAGMILVNNPGTWSDIYPPLRHAEWHGCTPTDLIFPFFLFIVGVAITLSLSKRKERGDDQTKLVLKILQRGATLFLLGLLLAAFPKFELETLRIPGVLQRIAVVYVVAALLFLKTNARTQAYVGGALLLVYWALMTLVPVPGYGASSFQPESNLGAWLDRALLDGHLWAYSKTWDPEGILSTIPAISTALAGVMLGHWLRTDHDDATKTAWIFTFGALAVAVGLFWDAAFPINKSLWTSSYVVYTAGLALLFFGVCYWLADAKGYDGWTKPFIVYGANAITVYFLSGVVAKILVYTHTTNAAGEEITTKAWIFQNAFAPLFENPQNASLAYALTYVGIWLGVMWLFYWRRIFIKV
jgi:predicted acyltransferase